MCQKIHWGRGGHKKHCVPMSDLAARAPAVTVAGEPAGPPPHGHLGAQTPALETASAVEDGARLPRDENEAEKSDVAGDLGMRICDPGVLTDEEAALRVFFQPGDDLRSYEGYFALDLGEFLRCIAGPWSDHLGLCSSLVSTSHDFYGVPISDPRAKFPGLYNGYHEWALPQPWQEEDPSDESLMMEMMLSGNRNFMYMINRVPGGQPVCQLRRFLSIPIKKELAEWTESKAHAALSKKLFVFKVVVCPTITGDVQIWRRISCFGGTRLDTFHDKILAPALGWIRHYHSHM